MAGIDGWMRKERELSLGPEGNFHKAYIQLFRGCSTSVSCFLISTWRVSLCSWSWKSSLWGPFLFTSLPCLLLQMTLGCVRRSAPGLEVWVALQTGVNLSRLLAGLGGGMCVELACLLSPEFRSRR